MDVMTRNARLVALGYLPSKYGPDDVEKGVRWFQENHGDEFYLNGYTEHNRECVADGDWGPVSQMLLNRPRTCDTPDIPRDTEGNVLEARWPDSCRDVEWSCNFLDEGAPGMSGEQTKHGVLLGLSQWNTIYAVNPGSGRITTITNELIEEFRKLGGDVAVAQFILWCGTLTHEVGHAVGLPHTPSDPNSVMYPSMRGQYLVNRTDMRNMTGRGYSQSSNVQLSLAEWQGQRGTGIWATIQNLSGNTLAWSYLPNGNCGEKLQQAYDRGRNWASGKIEMPTDPTPPPPPPPPEGGLTFGAEKLSVRVDGELVGYGRMVPWVE